MIKQLALGYLKKHYRLREREQNSATLTGLDLQGANNVVADAFLHYTQPDGQVFKATVEATSVVTRDEIYYRINRSHLIWDSLVFACLLLPVVFSFLHLRGVYLLAHDTFTLRVLFTFLTIPLLSFVYALFFWWLPRYRYISAVAQFKQYQADDQWIAFGYDVFDTRQNKYYNELARQCTRYGFGLLEITPRREVVLRIAPSKVAHFVPTNTTFNFLTRYQWQQQMRDMVKGPWQKFREWLRNFGSPLQNRYFKWFPRTYYNQWGLIGIGLVALLFFIIGECDRRPVHYPNETLYRNRTLAKAEENRPETRAFYADSKEPYVSLFDTVYDPYRLEELEEEFTQLVQVDASSDTTGIIEPPLRILSLSPEQEFARYYNCARFNGLHQNFYVLADTVYNSWAAARLRLRQFQTYGFSATAVWSPCLGGTANNYLIFLEDILLDSVEARALRDTLQLQMDSIERPLQLIQFNPISE